VNPEPRFLSIEEILALHAIAIEDQGGDPAIRDRGLLESAVAMPAQQLSGQFLHEGIPAMAAAYAFHISGNHPFVDGNKRAATAAMIAFLSDNGWRFDATADEAEPIILQLAAGVLNKTAFTDWAKKHMHEKPRLELREFFSRVRPDEFSTRFRSLLPGETGASPSEFAARGGEVAVSIPLLRDLERQQREARQAGNQNERDRITMLAVGIMTLYALAEDMGYEW
jgi:death-on-curing protein